MKLDSSAEYSKFILTFWRSLWTMRLHSDVRIQMVQGAVSLFTTIPSAFVHPLDLFVSPSRTLVLLRARNRDERIYCREWMPALKSN